MSSRTAAPSIFTARRIASAVALPGVFAGMLVFATPATASTSSTTTGVCHGIANQITSRGTFQPNLLKAAAKQNAAVISQLQLRRAGLVTQSGSLTSQITAAQEQIKDLNAAAVLLEGQIAASELRLSGLTESQTEFNRLVGVAEGQLADLETARGLKDLEHQAALGQVTAAEGELAGLQTEKLRVEGLAAQAERDLTAARQRLAAAVIAAADAQSAVDAQQETIRLATVALGDAVTAGEGTAQAVVDAQDALDEAKKALEPLVVTSAEATRLAGLAQTAVDDAEAELVDLRATALTADGAIAPAQQAFDDAEAAEALAQDAVDLKQAEVDAKQLELNAAEETDGDTVTTTTTDPALVQAEIDRLKAQRDALAKNENTIRGELNAKIKQLEDTRTLTTTQIIDNTALIDTLTEDLAVLNGQLESLNEDLTQAGIDSAARKGELDTAQANLELADAAVATQLQVIDGLEDAAGDADEEALRVARAVTAQEQEIARLTQELEDRQDVDDTAQALIGTLTTGLEGLNADLLLKQATRDEADQAVVDATADRDELITEIGRLGGLIDGLIEDIAAQERVIDDLEAAAGVLFGELATLDGQITEQEQALDRLREQLSEVGTAIAAEEEALAGLERQLEDNVLAVAAKEQLVDTLEAQNAAVLAEIKAIDAQLAVGGCVI